MHHRGNQGSLLQSSTALDQSSEHFLFSCPISEYVWNLYESYIAQLIKKQININVKHVILGSFGDILKGRDKKTATAILLIGRLTLHNIFHSNIKILKNNQVYLLGVVNTSMQSLKYIPSISQLRKYKKPPISKLDGTPFITLSQRFEANEKYVNIKNYLKNQRFASFQFNSPYNIFLYDDHY